MQDRTLILVKDKTMQNVVICDLVWGGGGRWIYEEEEEWIGKETERAAVEEEEEYLSWRLGVCTHKHMCCRYTSTYVN